MPDRDTLKPGTKARFQYPEHFKTLPDYSEHRGTIVTVLRCISENDPDYEHHIDPMYDIVGADGWKGAAWESELELLH